MPENLSRVSPQHLLIFVGLFEESAEGLTEPYPGCLFASYCYEAELFDARTLQIIVETMRLWRRRLTDKLEEVAARYPPRMEVDFASLADSITVVFEGSFMMSKTLQDPVIVAAQIRHYRNYLELLFSPD
jgi:TetR/AcrR family transcriptional repressor of nem operon